MKPALRILLLLLLIGVSSAGCKQIKKLLPATEVDNPAEGTREWLVYKAIEAAMIKEEAASYAAIRPLLHTDVVAMSSSENSFRTMNYPAFRRKVTTFTPDPSKPTYLLDYDQEDADDFEYRLFVVNKTSDMPSPFRLRRDPNANNEWRIANIP
jgi:hypothetical protein